MQFEYMVKSKGMSMWDDLEGFGETLQKMLNRDGNAYDELGWELLQVLALSDSDVGINGLIYVYRREKQ